MNNPELGVSLKVILHEVSKESCDTLFSSRIATCEISPDLFVSDLSGDKKEIVKQSLGANNVRVPTIHARFGSQYDLSALDNDVFQDGIDELLNAVDLAIELDAPIIVVHLSSEPVLQDERSLRIEQVKRALSKVEEYCKQNSKKMALELLPRSCIGNKVDELLYILDGLDEKVFGVCFDVNHLMDRYEDVASTVLKLNKRLMTLHLSDYDGVDEKHWVPGRGVIDWPAFMAALRKIDYAGPFNYESRFEEDSLSERIKSLEDNFDWLTSL
jgi:sugar phosphate isomerase/epimerase